MIDLIQGVKARDAARLGAVIEIGRKINTILDFDKLLDETVRHIREVFGFGMVSVFLLDQNDPNYLYHTACTDFSRYQPNRANKRIHISQGMVGWVVRNETSRLANDVSRDPYYIHCAGTQVVIDKTRDPYYIQYTDTRAELDLPLKINNSCIGVLNIEQPHIDAFDPEDVPALELLADQITIAIQNARLNALAREAAATEERNRLARELHDDTIQGLIGMGRQIDLLRCDVADHLGGNCNAVIPEHIEKRLTRLQDSLDATIQSLRFLSRDLRSQLLKDLGLAAAIEALVTDISRHCSINITTNINEDGLDRLRHGTHTQVYRIVQEALSNMIKHSRAKNAQLCLKIEGDLLLMELWDDGCGFEVPDDLTKLAMTGGMGVINMRQRARDIGGCLTIESYPGQGTRLSLELPGCLPVR